MEKISLQTAGLVVVKENKLLLAYSKNKNAWYLPGGKVDAGETSKTALKREIEEELNFTLNPEVLKYYCHISAPAYGENRNIIMEQDCFLYTLTEEVQPSNEIGGVKFFDYETYLSEPAQVVGVIEIFDRLHEDKILN